MAENVQPAEVIAKLLDVSERRVRQLSSEDVIPRAARGRYEVVGAVRGYIRYLRDLALKGETGAADYGLERARLVKARADLAGMEAARVRGDLIPAADVTAAWTEMVALMRSRLLALPDKIAPQLFTCGDHENTSIAEARDMLRHAIFEALGELAAAKVQLRSQSDGDGGLATGGDGDTESGGPAAEPDGDGVGGPKPQT